MHFQDPLSYLSFDLVPSAVGVGKGPHDTKQKFDFFSRHPSLDGCSAKPTPRLHNWECILNWNHFAERAVARKSKTSWRCIVSPFLAISHFWLINPFPKMQRARSWRGGQHHCYGELDTRHCPSFAPLLFRFFFKELN